MIFCKETDFQDSAIGKIPKDWTIKTTKEVGEVTTGTTPSTLVKEYWNGDYPFVTPSDITEQKYVEKTERKVSTKGLEKGRILPKDSVLVTCIASIGKIALAFEGCLTNQQINAIICKNEVNPHYVYYAIDFRTPVLESWAGKTTSPIVKKSLFEKFPIPMPTNFSEQQAVVEVLDVVDSAIELAGQVIAKTERLKKGLMRQLLTHGMGHTEYRQTLIGKLPKKWEVSRLSEVARVNVGYVGPISQFYTDSEKDGVTLLSTTNVTEKGLRLDDLKFVTPEFHERNKKSQVYPGTVLIARHGLSGTAALIPESLKKANCLNVVVVHPSNNLNPKFMEYIFNFKQFRERLLGWKTGSVQGVVNTKILEKTLVPVPPLDEQKKIIEILSAADAKLDIEERGKVKLETVKRGLMDLLLTGKVRIKVD